MGNQSFFVLAMTLCLLLAGCGKETSSGSQPLSDMPVDKSDQQRRSNSGTQVLVVYNKGDNPRLNELQATNVTDRKPTFDFTFKADQDETLTLAMNTVKSTLLGCNDSGIGFSFSLYRVGADGAIDLSGYSGLGPSPVSVKKGGQYVVRVTLILDRDCLGISYKFGIETAPTT